MSRRIAHNQLENLLPTQLDEVVSQYGMPRKHVRREVTPSQQIEDLIQYAEGLEGKELTRLLAVISSISGTTYLSAGNLVYFLVDRKPQEYALRNALKTWTEQQDKPFVCVFYGQDKQHDRFVERLLTHFFKDPDLSQLLKEPRDMANGNAFRLPYLQYLKNLDELPSELESYLTQQQIPQKMQREYHRRPVLYFEMDSREWKSAKQRNTVSEFIRYWQAQCPQSKYPPLIFLCFHCLPPQSWLNKLFPRDASMTWLDTQSNSAPTGFQQTFGLPGIVLPKLDSIDCRDIMDWADLIEVRNLHPHIQAPALKLCIEQHLCHNKVPMRQLGVELEKIILSSFPQGVQS